MDASTIIIAVVLLALAIIPVVLLNKSGKKNKLDDNKEENK